MAVPVWGLALISYGVLDREPALNERFQRFYWDEIGPYWPPERNLVDTGYATIDFPFEELAAPSFEIRVDWRLSEFLGYLRTWSAVRRAQEAGHVEGLQRFANDISAAWGDENTRHTGTWSTEESRVGKKGVRKCR